MRNGDLQTIKGYPPCYLKEPGGHPTGPADSITVNASPETH